MLAYLAALCIAFQGHLWRAREDTGVTVDRDHPPISELVSLSGRSAVITGGATGLGLAICRRIAEAGAQVLIADVDTEAARKSAVALAASGHQATSTHCDVTNEASVTGMVRTAVDKMGGIDILVNNAGVYPRIPLTETTADDFDRVLAVNLKGAFLCSREASRCMIEQRKGGCIINLGSIDSLHPSSSGMAAYDSSKGGILMLTRSMARELGEYGIRVNAIAPGAIKTRAIATHTAASPDEGTREQLRELKAFMTRMALGRMGDPDEVGRVALFLASDLASYVTGTLAVVDGGYLVS